MHEAEKLNLEQMEAFLKASASIRFEGETPKQVYSWIEQVLCQQRYHQLRRPARGLVRRYLEKMTGLSRAQVTRLIARYLESGAVHPIVLTSAIVFRNAIGGPTSSCWPLSMRRTRT